MEFLPLCIDIRQRKCLVVGGGQTALRKTHLLIKAGANVDVLAPSILPQLANIVPPNGGRVIKKHYDELDITKQYDLVVATTNNKEVNYNVAIVAKKLKIPVNVTDESKLSDFIFPAVIDRNPIFIAISSNTYFPALVRHIRTRLEAILPHRLGKIATLIAKFRSQVQERFLTSKERSLFWQYLLSSPATEKILCGQEKAAEELIKQHLSKKNYPSIGEVFLLGAGPGDPDLLTFRAYRLMQVADVILYDRLVSDDILDLVNVKAEKKYVGKERGDHTLSQHEINMLMVSEVKQGRNVARLKGGDPFIFARGGEEISYLAEQQIPFQVVPGITAANGCAAYAGIPLTHRDYATSVRFLAGYLNNGQLELNWNNFNDPHETLVFYMSLQGVEIICHNLMTLSKLSGQTPVAMIMKGTTQEQEVITSSLENVSKEISTVSLKSPLLLIVGQVVSLSTSLQWFQRDNNRYSPFFDAVLSAQGND